MFFVDVVSTTTEFGKNNFFLRFSSARVDIIIIFCFIVCPPEFSELTLMSGAPQFEVIGLGDFVTPLPGSGGSAMVDNILLGSGASVVINGRDSVLVKVLCERAILLSLSVRVNGASAVEFIYEDGANGVVRTKRVSICRAVFGISHHIRPCADLRTSYVYTSDVIYSSTIWLLVNKLCWMNRLLK